MGFKFYADKSWQTLSILILPNNNPMDKPVQVITTFLTYPGHLAKCTEKQKAWLEANRWQVLVSSLIQYDWLIVGPVVAANG